MQAGLRWTLMIFLPANWILGSALEVKAAAVAVGRNSVFKDFQCTASRKCKQDLGV